MDIYCLRISIAECPCMDIPALISTLVWIIEDWHPKIMDIHDDIRGFFEILVWICYGFSNQGWLNVVLILKSRARLFRFIARLLSSGLPVPLCVSQSYNLTLHAHVWQVLSPLYLYRPSLHVLRLLNWIDFRGNGPLTTQSKGILSKGVSQLIIFLCFFKTSQALSLHFRDVFQT